MKTKISIIFLFLLIFDICDGQNAPFAFKYQTSIKDSLGTPRSNFNAQLRISLIPDSVASNLLWQELHSVTSNQYGEVIVFIGNGISTQQGISNSFQSVNWNTDSIWIKIELNNGSGNFIPHSLLKFSSVFYSLYSNQTRKTTNNKLDDFFDVNISSQVPGSYLIWNGQNWQNQLIPIQDSVLFSIVSGFAQYSDSSEFAGSLINIPDSAIYSVNTDSSIFGNSSNFTFNSNQSFFSDTVNFAFSFPQNNWKLIGNTISPGNFLGTSSNNDFILKTNAIERLRINGNDNRICFLSNSDTAQFSANLIDGFLYAGTAGPWINPTSYPVLLFLPSRASFRMGMALGNQFDSLNVGNYSMGMGLNVSAGNYGLSIGKEISSSGENAMIFGRNSLATITGTGSGGTCLIIGDSNSVVSGGRSILLGRSLSTNSLATHVLGWRSSATSSISLAMGTNCSASSGYSFVLGTNASSSNKIGSFVFSGSSPNVFNSNSNNSFNIRASGGIVLYSDSLQMMGVTLYAGSGSWASVSDRRKKKNIKSLNYEQILGKFNNIEIHRWSYKTQLSSTKHLGVLSQDFYRVFQIGENPETISAVDADGVISAGIKGLIDRVEDLKKIESFHSEIEFIQNNLDTELIKQNEKLKFLESEIVKLKGN